jgi:uncharacterized LabA/DUF88 family protein
MRVSIFVDGGYLKYAKDKSPIDRIYYPRLPDALIKETGVGLDLVTSYFYDCRPLGENQGYNKILDRLENWGYKPRFGSLKAEGCRHCGRRPRQKGVDVLLALDLLLDTMARSIDAAILLTNDSDFLPAIEEAQKRGLRQTWVAMHPADRVEHRDLTSRATVIDLSDKLFSSLRYEGPPRRP